MNEDKFFQLMSEAAELDSSPTQVAILKEAVRIADAGNSIEHGFEARIHLVRAATFSGDQQTAIVAFSWVLAKSDDDPMLGDPSTLLWWYKWIYSAAAKFPNISLEQLQSIQADITQRFVDEGSTLQVIHSIAARNAIDTGNLDIARQELKLWQASSRDDLSDCEACDLSHRVRVLVELGDYADAVQAAHIIFDQNLGCEVVPQSTYGHILAPLVHLGEIEQAERFHKIGYPQISGNPNFVDTAADHLMYMVSQNKEQAGVQCLERHLPLALRRPNGYERLIFLFAAQLLIDSLIRNGNQTKRKFRLPDSVNIPNDDGLYELADLQSWFKSQVIELEQQFNKRNGNSFFSERLATRHTLIGGAR